MSELLGAMLVDEGVITRSNLDLALARQRRHGGRLASICLEMELAREHELAIILARYKGVPFVVFEQSAIHVSMTNLIPHKAACQLNALPLQRSGDSLTIALANPSNKQTINSLHFGTGAQIIECGAILSALRSAIDGIYQMRANSEEGFFQGADLNPYKVRDETGFVSIVKGVEDLDTVTPGGSFFPKGGLDLTTSWTREVPVKQPSAQAQVEEKKPLIYVVDDEADLRHFMVQALLKEGYTCREAQDGSELMRMLKQQLPHAVVLDAMLPGTHGFDVCRQLKSSEAAKHVQVVMVSAVYNGWRYAEDIRHMYGADAFLEKPFRLEKLKQTLRDCLAGRDPQAQAAEMTVESQQLLAQAAQAYQQEDWQLAVNKLEEATNKTPFSADLYQRLALLYDKVKQPHRALAALERAADLGPSFSKLVELARRYEKEGYARKAFDAWERCYLLADTPKQVEGIKKRLNQLLPKGP